MSSKARSAYDHGTTVSVAHYGAGRLSAMDWIFADEGAMDHVRRYLRDRVTVDGTCLVWPTGSGAYRPYGTISVQYRGRRLQTAAHRLMLSLSLGRPLLAGMTVDHLDECPKTCITPAHLREMSLTENSKRAGTREAWGLSVGRVPTNLRQWWMLPTDRKFQLLEATYGADNCHPFPGRLNRGGYATIGSRLAHVLALILHDGLDERPRHEDGRPLHVDHLCKNRACVNWRHLRWARADENCTGQNRNGGRCRRGHLIAGANKSHGCRSCNRAAAQFRDIVAGRSMTMRDITDRETWVREYADAYYARLGLAG